MNGHIVSEWAGRPATPGSAARRRRRKIGRKPSAAELLRQVRQYHTNEQLAGRSDAELREALGRVRTQANPARPGDSLPAVFAIGDEAIRRRLGAWRVFDPAFDRRGLEDYFRLAQSGEWPPLPNFDSEPIDADGQAIIDGIREAQAAAEKGRQALLPAAFYRALARRDEDNRLRFEATDEQILAGIHLFRGKVVELDAGEGKTIAAAFPAILHAVLGRSVHVITANDYLAARDCDLLTPVYRLLGLNAGAALGYMTGPERRGPYARPIVYGTMREFGFDFLRDNLAMSAADRVQPDLDAAIIDEVDQALIDEARTPMIIAGSPALHPRALERAGRAVAQMMAGQWELAGELRCRLEATPFDGGEWAALFGQALLAQPEDASLRRLAAANPRGYRKALAALYPDGSDYPDESLTANLYYLVDPEERFVTLTDKGVAYLETRLGDFYAAGQVKPASRPGETAALSRDGRANLNLTNQVYQLLRANLLLKRDVDYIVTDNALALLDPYTGRPRPDTRYRNGLHPALEAKESLPVHPDCESLAEITVQGFTNRYRLLAGLTGTATAAVEEFRRKYSLDVVRITAARPSRRQDLPSRVYGNEGDKVAAIVEEVAAAHWVGRPVLVAVQSVEQSARLSERLRQAGLDHRLLNAKTGHSEAEIVRRAGAFGAVTVATNMAGRGTDILLEPDLEQRILEGTINLIEQRLGAAGSPVTIRCYTPEEGGQLAAALANRAGLSVTRRRLRRGAEITVAGLADRHIPGHSTPPSTPAMPLEFGLGLYVISAEFTESPRVSLQLQGRSGRQGNFGATRLLLSWDDRGLAYRTDRGPGLPGCRRTDAGGRVYYEGPAVEKLLRRRQEAAETEGALHRSIIQDYAAVGDAYTETYYRARREIMDAPSLFPAAAALTPPAAARLVERHFPGLDGANYQRRIRQLCAEAEEWYGVAGCGLAGRPLDQLGEELAALLTARLRDIREQLGDAGFNELARLLLLQAGDEAWRDFRAGLESLTLVSRMGQFGHKSAVADFVIHAAVAWQDFREGSAALALSRLLTFPLSRLAADSVVGEGRIELDEAAARLLLPKATATANAG